MHPGKSTTNWQKALTIANSTNRCGAKIRAAHSCKSPAMMNGRCRMHGGKSTGAPCDTAHGGYKHGKHTNESIQERRDFYEFKQYINSFRRPSTRIYLEDIDFKIGKRETLADIEAVAYKVWNAVRIQKLSLEESKVIYAHLTKKKNGLMKEQIDQLVIQAKGKRMLRC